MGALPERYEYRAERLRGRFREDLCAFTRQLILADPQDLISAAHLIQEHRHELEYLAGLIKWRLELREQKQNEWNSDNPFYWRFALHGRGVPPDTEEHAAAFYERGDYERAKAVFQLLFDCFDGYAEGHNYLGLIALEQRKLDEAVASFEKTIEIGREFFPAGISKKRYWSDHVTRPYMRGLRNLALTLNQASRFDEALALCDRLEQECGDEFTAAAHRADIYLNTRKWQRAAEYARRSGGDLDPSAGFTEAFALFELGRREDALAPFLRAALHYPRTARMLAGERAKVPKSREEIEDHNTGVSLRRTLHAYLRDRPRAAKRFFRAFVRDPRVMKLLDESIIVVRRWREDRTGDRSAFDRMTLMLSRDFASVEAHKLRDLVAPAAERRALLH
jgi:tetratricopeptide (TPR) repeat protein